MQSSLKERKFPSCLVWNFFVSLIWIQLYPNLSFFLFSFSSNYLIYRSALQKKLEQRGREMLQNMSENEGVRTLDSGVVLHVLEHGPEGEGEGPRPTKASVVEIHYHGTLADGTVFDSTLSGDPAKIPLAQVIPGWRDGVLAMHEGETAMLGIPPEQAYGPNGTPDGRVPGGSTLFFKIQLLKILTGSVGGGPKLVDAAGNDLGGDKSGGGLVGADGKPL